MFKGTKFKLIHVLCNSCVSDIAHITLNHILKKPTGPYQINQKCISMCTYIYICSLMYLYEESSTKTVTQQIQYYTVYNWDQRISLY